MFDCLDVSASFSPFQPPLTTPPPGGPAISIGHWLNYYWACLCGCNWEVLMQSDRSVYLDWSWLDPCCVEQVFWRQRGLAFRHDLRPLSLCFDAGLRHVLLGSSSQLFTTLLTFQLRSTRSYGINCLAFCLVVGPSLRAHRSGVELDFWCIKGFC